MLFLTLQTAMLGLGQTTSAINKIFIRPNIHRIYSSSGAFEYMLENTGQHLALASCVAYYLQSL